MLFTDCTVSVPSITTIVPMVALLVVVALAMLVGLAGLAMLASRSPSMDDTAAETAQFVSWTEATITVALLVTVALMAGCVESMDHAECHQASMDEIYASGDKACAHHRVMDGARWAGSWSGERATWTTVVYLATCGDDCHR